MAESVVSEKVCGFRGNLFPDWGNWYSCLGPLQQLPVQIARRPLRYRGGIFPSLCGVREISEAFDRGTVQTTSAFAGQITINNVGRHPKKESHRFKARQHDVPFLS